MNEELEGKAASAKKVKVSEAKKPAASAKKVKVSEAKKPVASAEKVRPSEIEKSEKQLRIKLVKSGIGFSSKQKKVIQGLGFSKLNQTIARPDTPQIRGMVFKVKHLLEVTKD